MHSPSHQSIALHCLITLSGQLANDVCAAITAQQGHAVLLPTLIIEALKNPTGGERISAQFDNYDQLIFVSPNAVSHGLYWFKRQGLQERLLEKQLAAVGPGTAACLAPLGQTVIYPEKATGAAALLLHAAMQTLTNQSILIVRGVGSNDELASELRRRGAQVDYLDIYQRRCPALLTTTEMAALFPCNTAIIGSRQSWTNLCAILPAEATAWLSQLKLLLPNQTTITDAVQMGHQGQRILLKDMRLPTILQSLFEA